MTVTMLALPLSKVNFKNTNQVVLGSRSVDLIGKVFGRLTVIAMGLKDKQRNLMWVCACECGSEKSIRGFSLTNGSVNTCGCKIGHVPYSIHGRSGELVYKVWTSMWSRCTNPNDSSYAAYKDRAPPESWRNFDTFISDMGERPSHKHSLERVDNSKGYGPDNCEWATRDIQNSNKSNTIFITYEGTTKPASVWAKERGIDYAKLRHRHFNAGWSAAEALGFIKRPYVRHK